MNSITEEVRIPNIMKKILRRYPYMKSISEKNGMQDTKTHLKVMSSCSNPWALEIQAWLRTSAQTAYSHTHSKKSSSSSSLRGCSQAQPSCPTNPMSQLKPLRNFLSSSLKKNSFYQRKSVLFRWEGPCCHLGMRGRKWN